MQQKWIALSNTTLGQLMATINTSIIIVALPPIFRGIDVNPLAAGSFSYLLWVIMSYMIVVSVLLVTIGRISDMYGRVRLFNLGFLIFTIGSVLLYITPNSGNLGALEIIIFRVIQAVGGSFLMANSIAIITDSFEPNERGFAVSINSFASVTGVSVGIVLGGILSIFYWRDVFLISIPIGAFGTVWSYLMLKETSTRKKHTIDYKGNIVFAGGIIILLVGITYGIAPYGKSAMGWSNPMVLLAISVGAGLLAIFPFIEMHVKDPMFKVSLFRNREFSIGNFTAFISAMGMMGLLYMLTVLFQGVWLPLHGYRFSVTPLWAGIYMLPMTISMGIFGIMAGRISDRHGPRLLTVCGLLVSGVSVLALIYLPYDFSYAVMGMILAIFGLGYGLFNSPNIAAVMSSVPPDDRGTASGMLNTMRNTGYTASMGAFFSILILGLSRTLPSSIISSLSKEGAGQLSPYLSNLPPTEAIFGAFLGINPAKAILQALPSVPTSISSSTITSLESRIWFPNVIAPSFMSSLDIVFLVGTVITLFAAVISIFRETKNGSEIKPSTSYMEIKDSRDP